MLFRNFDFATKYYDYQSNTELEMTSNPQINGWYKFIDGLLTALFVTDGKLYFLYGEEKILITEFHRVLLKEINNVENEFSLININDVLVRFLYSISDSKLNVSPFEYIDEDDFKWGDFIAKIINDKERKQSYVMNLLS